MTIRFLLLFLLVGSLTACSTGGQSGGGEGEVRATMERFMEDLNALDADAIMAHFADDANAFFPLARPDRANGKAEITPVFETYTEETKKRISRTNIVPEDQVIDVTGNVAVVSFNVRNDQSVARRTFILELRGSRWLITHMHASNFRLATP